MNSVDLLYYFGQDTNPHSLFLHSVEMSNALYCFPTENLPDLDLFI